MAAVRFPVFTETRLTVALDVSSTQSDPAPTPIPHEPSPTFVRPTILFVAGSMRRSRPPANRLTHTELPPATAAHGCVPAGTGILATTSGDFAAPQATAAKVPASATAK